MITARAIALVLLLSGATAGTASASFYGTDGFTPPALRGTPQFFVSGHGWGHGVGMSQYGAYGYAQHGYTYDQILAHYYPGTELGQTAVKTIRVLLASAPSVTISSTGPWKLKDGAAAAVKLDAGKVTLNSKLTFKLPGATEAQTFTGPLAFTSSAPLVFGKPYRGTLTVASDGKTLTLVDTLPLDEYLDGVVPSEMPSTWLPDALKAQAVAARSYAIAKHKTTGAFDVYPDTRDQVYGGVVAERPTATAAVTDTTGQVLEYGGKIATTYFFSTSGGRTASVADVFKTAPVPYLVSVPDPYDSISPYHDWGPFPFTPAKLQRALKVPGRLLDVQTTANSSGRVAGATAVGDQGDVELTGTDVQKALGLRSTWFSVGVLALDPLPAKPLTYGAPLTLTGLGRRMPALELEERTASTDEWAPSRPVLPAPDGTFSLRLKAALPTEYRVTSGTLATTETELVVAPVVALKLAADYSSVSGTVQPKLPGAPVQVQQLAPTGRWATLAKTTVAANARFAATLDLTAGTYRARVAAGHGWAVAISAKVVAG